MKDGTQEFYNSNKDFRDYVDRYCKKYMEGRSITVEEALEHEQVRLVAEQYREQENNILAEIGKE